MALTKKEQERMENLLKPGEEPGEGYEGSPDMYPDYEEDKKLSPTDKKIISESYQRIKAADKKVGRSAPRMYHGGSVTVKTKLGRNKPTKIC
jgi:hypothetical protein